MTTTNSVRLAVVLATVPFFATAVAPADEARFRQGVGGYSGTKDVELRGGKAIPDPPKEGSKKAEAPKKKAEAPKEAEAPKASDASISVDLDNDGHQSQGLIRFGGLVGEGSGRIPRGSTVTSAVLTLHGNNSGGGKVFVHRVLAAWDPSDVSWEAARLGGNAEGGIQADDREATPAIASFDSKRKGTIEIDVLPAVKLWVSGDAKNYGLALTSDNGNGWDFDTSEAEAVENRPMLTITFTPPAGR